MNSPFADAVEHEFAFLIDDRDFRLATASGEVVRFASPRVEVQLSYHPSEQQVDLAAYPVGERDPYTRFVWRGMVGRASVERLVQLAAAALRANEPALSGDDAYYRELGAEQRQDAEAWTAFCAGQGPQPTGQLP
jgi:hypothetical protein